MLLKLLILSVFAFAGSEKVRYDDFALYKIIPESENHVQFLKDLQDRGDGLEFWNLPTRIGEYVSVVAAPEKRKELEHSLSKRSIYNELMVENIQEAFDAQLYSRKKRSNRAEMHFTGFHTLEDINNWFEYLAETHSDFVTLIYAGTSFEGRNITGVKIARNSGQRAFFLEGGQIGADWLSPTVVCYIVDQLVKGEDPEALAASQEFEWHIFPSVNPDGLEFSDNNVRLWVKNRRPQRFGQIGVDLTKNWNSQWGVHGGSFTPADTNYIGIGPFSEPETRGLSHYIETIGHNLAGALSFRAFGQRLIIPFAHTTDPLYNFDEMMIIGRRAMGALSVKYNTNYQVGTSLAVHDGATGMLADWIKYRFRAPVVATYQLRDNIGWGYVLPVAQVLPSCEETYDSVMAIIREAKLLNVL